MKFDWEQLKKEPWWKIYTIISPVVNGSISTNDEFEEYIDGGEEIRDMKIRVAKAVYKAFQRVREDENKRVFRLLENALAGETLSGMTLFKLKQINSINTKEE